MYDTLPFAPVSMPASTSDAAATPLVLAEPALFYDPPYERPLEDEFAWHLVKYLGASTGLLYQAGVDTPAGRFWIDFVVEHGARRVGFEIGELEHTSEHDHLRDALILGTGAVDVLYRFRGVDVLHHLHDGLHLVSRWDPDLFSPRGRINLHTLASAEARTCELSCGAAHTRVPYPTPATPGTVEGETFEWPETHRPDDALLLRRLSRRHPTAWLHDHDRALTHYGATSGSLPHARRA